MSRLVLRQKHFGKQTQSVSTNILGGLGLVVKRPGCSPQKPAGGAPSQGDEAEEQGLWEGVSGDPSGMCVPGVNLL